MMAKRMSRSKKTGDPPPIDLVVCRRLLGALVMQLKQYEGEVSAYRMMIAALRQSRPDIPWDKMLEKNRSSRRFQQQLHRKYDAPLGIGARGQENSGRDAAPC